MLYIDLVNHVKFTPKGERFFESAFRLYGLSGTTLSESDNAEEILNETKKLFAEEGHAYVVMYNRKADGLEITTRGKEGEIVTSLDLTDEFIAHASRDRRAINTHRENGST